MVLVSTFFGYRLNISDEKKFQRSKSIQLYRGVIGKLMVALKLAFTQQFLDSDGKQITLAVNKKSLGHYIWRHNRCRDHKNSNKMKHLYNISHRFFHKKCKIHRHYTREMCFLLDQRKLFKNKSMHFAEFASIVNQQAPLIGEFYKIKNSSNQTVGYLLGTDHFCNKLVNNLNPSINKALSKTRRLCLETSYYLNKDKIKFEEIFNFIKSFDIKSNRIYLIHYKFYKRVNLFQKYDTAICCLKKLAEINNLVQLSDLETKEEHQKALERIRYPKNPPKLSITALRTRAKSVHREYLSGTFRVSKYLDQVNAETERNALMTERFLPFLNQDERPVAAVGNLHLMGEKSMVKLLEDKGYILTRS